MTVSSEFHRDSKALVGRMNAEWRLPRDDARVDQPDQAAPPRHTSPVR